MIEGYISYTEWKHTYSSYPLNLSNNIVLRHHILVERDKLIIIYVTINGQAHLAEFALGQNCLTLFQKSLSNSKREEHIFVTIMSKAVKFICYSIGKVFDGKKKKKNKDMFYEGPPPTITIIRIDIAFKYFIDKLHHVIGYEKQNTHLPREDIQ